MIPSSVGIEMGVAYSERSSMGMKRESERTPYA